MSLTTLKNLTFSKIRACALPAAIAAAGMLAGCGGFIYDGEGDCDPRYKVRFVFDKNLSFADAFSHEVNAVTLYIVEPESGRIIWSKSESGESVKAEGYMMDVDVEPGTYRLIAWCGEGAGTHFDIPQADIHTGLTCTLARARGENGEARVDHDLKRLYHGRLEGAAFVDDEGTHVHTVHLVKNTNDVNVVLQNLSGKPLDSDKFSFTITDANGTMDWDNSIMPDETITYHAHDVRSGTAGVVMPDEGSRAITAVSACVASLTTARLMENRRGSMMLNVYNTEKGTTVASVPLIDYALMVKGRYEGVVSDQDYLDRQDKYDVVFFLDENNEWPRTHIYINSWKIVLQNTDL